MKVRTEIDQTVTFEDAKFMELSNVSARFEGGVLKTVKFMIDGQDSTNALYVDLADLKELRKLFDDLITFADGNQKETAEKLEQGKTRLIRL